MPAVDIVIAVTHLQVGLVVAKVEIVRKVKQFVRFIVLVGLNSSRRSGPSRLILGLAVLLGGPAGDVRVTIGGIASLSDLGQRRSSATIGVLIKRRILIHVVAN